MNTQLRSWTEGIGDWAGGLGARLVRVERADAALQVERESYAIDIYASESDWHLTVLETGKSTVLRTAAHGQVDAGVLNTDAVLANLKAAFAAMKSHERERCSRINLCIADSAMELLDNRQIRVPPTDTARIVKFASEIVGKDQCAYDLAEFGQSGSGEIPRCIFAFMALDRLRLYLASAGELAIKISSVMPAAACLSMRADDAPERSHGALLIGIDHSVVYLMEAASGSFLARRVPVGIRTLAQALVDANSLPMVEALGALQRRNLLAKLPSERPDGPGELPAQYGAMSRALAPALWDLRDGIAETLEYFCADRVAELPRNIEVFGPTDAATGLMGWLSGCGLSSFAPCERGFAELFTAMGRSKAMNVLRGTDQPLIVRGRIRYRFEHDQFAPTEQATDDAPARERERDDDAANPAKPKAKAGSSDTAGTKRPSAVWLSALCPIALAYMVYDFDYLGRARQLAVGTSSLEGTVGTIAGLRAQQTKLSRQRAAIPNAVSSSTDKILWTEKFQIIAEEIPETLWLRDTYIAQSERRVGNVDVVTTKFVLRGAAPMNSQDHLRDIARFIDRLNRSAPFMNDFRRITFEGAEKAADTSDSIVRFEIHAWYDENKRKGGGASRPTADKGDALGAMQRSIDRRSRRQGDLVSRPGTVRRP